MNAEEGQPEPQPGGEAQPTEEEMRQRIEEQLRKVRVQDLLLESVVSVLNLAARRIAKEDEQDLEQGRIGIEAVRAVVDLLDPEPAAQVRSALSEVQMLYAKYANEGGEPPEEGGSQPPEGGQPPPPAPGSQGGPSKLWTPGRG
ncbi:MAG TPA: hypothetical protein VEP94_03665 [Solirubrobacterales bacterium]|jgi:hypothetical protein|nr:hypothetical protein [Solirubrobacterales bacterium]